MARQLFGTDGIRGAAGEYPLDPRTTHALGVALGRWAASHDPAPEVLIGMDTRESSEWLARQVAGGLAEAGVKPRFAGLITTPGVAYLTRNMNFVAGVMISASHNPYQDNGIKIFDRSGFKLPDAEEHALEDEIFTLLRTGVNATPAQLTTDEGLDAAYIDYLAATMSCKLTGLNLVVDCANGAASQLAGPLFERLGANVTEIACSPDGRNINLNCGALHVDKLREEVLRRGADAGVAFDGDADRCIMVSPTGNIVDGDAILLICAREMELKNRTVVATVMSNLGLERALSASGIKLLRTAVGDKYVLEEMVRQDVALGGEQSGHVIFRDYATTGDGMLTALRLLEIVCKTRRTLDDLMSDLQVYPQVLINIKVKEKKPIANMPAVQNAIESAESAFGDRGRILVRFSGTEALARVMVEGVDQGEVRQAADQIADAIRAEIGT